MTDKYIYHELRSCIGGDENSEIVLVTNMETGESFIKLKMCYLKRYKTSELEKAMSDMEILNGNGFITDIDRLIKMRHIDVCLEHLREENHESK